MEFGQCPVWKRPRETQIAEVSESSANSTPSSPPYRHRPRASQRHDHLEPIALWDRNTPEYPTAETWRTDLGMSLGDED